MPGRETKFFASFALFVWKRFVHPLFKKADELSRQAVGAAPGVHRPKGPGLIFNFHELKLTDGIVRMILPGAGRERE